MNIEFCGLPGCGKSFLINELLELISEDKYKVLNLTAKSGNPCFAVREIKGLKRRVRISTSPLIRKERKALQLYVKKNPINRRTSVFYRILMEEMLNIKKSKDDYDLIFGNEGIVQSLSSLSHSRKFDKDTEKLISVIDKNFYREVETILFYCSTDRKTNIERIRIRNKTDDRFLSSNEKRMNRALDIKSHNIDYIVKQLKNVKVIRIDTTERDSAISSIVMGLEEYYDIHAKNL